MRLIAIGTRMPGWVDQAFEDYSRRLRSSWELKFTALASARRSQGSDEAKLARAGEARRILALLGARDFVVALDEHGAELTTVELAHWLEERHAAGQPLTFIIGGPDGLDAAVLARSQYRLALSRLTLPHGLARVLLAEQLYRAFTVLVGHPYHRA
jgi:23S rRNA (pseudouridine1915-N3)-methyltransferase